ncbi:MAG: SH3 domain-containing protein [Lachnospiraceae bacterium]|nr:SH3 domain-containing protein [Lachnospiraceae bacterium]
MPLILLICVVITVISAVSINRKEAIEREMAAAAEDAAQDPAEPVTADTDIIATPQYELQKITEDDAEFADIYNMIVSYYHARLRGDLLTASAINPFLNDVEKIRFEEYSNYLEDYPVIDVYLKPGLTTGTYVAYICAETKFTDLDVTLPGMQTYYIGLNDDGSYYMADSTYDETVYDYIMKLTLQDDVIELNNKVSVPYNELVETNEEVGEYMAYLREKVKEDVGEKLAELETGESIADAAAQVDTATGDANAESTPAPTEITIVKKVKATDVVNIRKSDSEQADKLDKASVGQEFTLIGEKPNGWTEVEYKGASAFIKSDYLEPSETEIVPADSVNTENGDHTGDADANADGDDTAQAGNDTAAATPSPSASPSPSPAPARGKVKVTDSGVRIRKEPTTESDILTTVYAGEQLDLIESLSSGWSKVKIKDVTGYTKSEFLKEVK